MIDPALHTKTSPGVNASVDHANSAPDCDVQLIGDQARGHTAHCTTHQCSTREQWKTPKDATQQFICDRGKPEWFVVELDGEPSIVDHSGLHRQVMSFVEGCQYGVADSDLRLWRWLGAGCTEELTLKRTTTDPLTFDNNDHATDEWIVVDPRCVVHDRTTVVIDGRA